MKVFLFFVALFVVLSNPLTCVNFYNKIRLIIKNIFILHKTSGENLTFGKGGSISHRDFLRRNKNKGICIMQNCASLTVPNPSVFPSATITASNFDKNIMEYYGSIDEKYSTTKSISFAPISPILAGGTCGTSLAMHTSFAQANCTSITVWNPNLTFNSATISVPSDDLVLYGYEDSTTEAYAASKSITFVALD